MNNRILFYTIVKLWSDERTKASMYQGGGQILIVWKKRKTKGRKQKKLKQILYSWQIQNMTHDYNNII